MVQKFHENVEIGNKVNFRDKIFMITETFRDFINTTCDFTLPTFSARSNARYDTVKKRNTLYGNTVLHYRISCL